MESEIRLAGLDWRVEPGSGGGLMLRCLGHMDSQRIARVRQLGRQLELAGLGKRTGAWYLFVKDEPALFWFILSNGANS